MPHTFQHNDYRVIMQEMLHRYRAYGDEQGVIKIQEAFDYAQKAHTGITRKSGDDYIIHPVSAVQELMVLQPDSTTIMATLLHDSVSHGN